MVRFTIFILVLCLANVQLALAQQIEQGKLKLLDLDKKLLVVTSNNQDRELILLDRTQVIGAAGATLAERLKDFKTGAEMFFRAEIRDGKEVALAVKLAAPGERPPGANNPQRGTLRKIDPQKLLVAIQIGEAVREFHVTEQTQVRGVPGDSLAERLQALMPGQKVQFLSTTQDGAQRLTALAADSPSAPGQRVSPGHSNLRPLNELGSDSYEGHQGGLYPHGSNRPPPAHEAAGLKLASMIQPLSLSGKPDPNGRIVLLSLGMSNTSQVSEGFQEQLNKAEGLHPRLLFINGAQGGKTAEAIVNPEDGRSGTDFWNTVDQRLKSASASRLQVQAVWIKQADGGPSQGFPQYAKKLQAELQRIVQIVAQRFPNVKLAYLSSRTYGGYATTRLNPEPYAYESGFSVKWLIEDQINGKPGLNFDPTKGEVQTPWLGWGPYLWANGATKRTDGFAYDPSDFAGDGTHHARAGQRKVGELLLKFFQQDITTRPWFCQQ